MKKHSKLVKLSSGEQALREPQFLVEHEGKLYLTLAVREFDPKYAGIKPSQERSIQRLKEILQRSPAVGKATRFSPSGFPAPPRPPRPGPPLPDSGSDSEGDSFAATDPPP